MLTPIPVTTRELDPDFLALTRAHEDTLLRAARLLTGDWDAAEGLLRDTLAWALSGWASLGGDAAAPLRLRQRLVQSYLESEPPPPGEEDEAEGGIDGAGTEAGAASPARGPSALTESVAGLPADERAVAVSRYYLGLSTAEIGEVLGVGTEDVAAAAARALTVLRWAR